ncbi:unnamed protein product [Cyprideis torosa]|uniref:Uncharacterized protein n=1 Tax=Cyprideis torosa TaxID=163714 RepID=A0A7R8WK91_9CRUS|nr:unnamed protein product [Cyprideis torosa]CAG0896683.1 unnamed protein product [Cyprideis torosa]
MTNEGQGESNMKTKSDDSTPDKIDVTAGYILHRVPCFGYVLQESSLPGSLDAKICKSLGVEPGPDFGRLKAGNSVTTEAGKVVQPSDVIGPPRPGRKLGFLGDTHDASPMAHLLLDVDLLVHEATLEDAMKEKALQTGHSTPSMAVRYALSVSAKRLALNHFSPRYKPLTGTPANDLSGPADYSKGAASGDESEVSSVDILKRDAEAALKSQDATAACQLIMADDYGEIDIPPLHNQ